MPLTPAPRSVRNNNPGNIERSGNLWAGLMPQAEMTPEQKAETRFCVFRLPVYGFRALAIDLRSKAARGLNTIAKIIPVYAPAPENDPESYIHAVCDMTGMARDAVLDLDDVQELTGLVRAIAAHEAGGWFFNTADLALAVQMVLRPPVSPVDRVIA